MAKNVRNQKYNLYKKEKLTKDIVYVLTISYKCGII